MSYDLMVFDKVNVPKNRIAFMKWFEEHTNWNENHEYNDPKLTTDKLKNWFMEIIKIFPQMDGTFAPTIEEINKMENDSYVTGYSIGKNIIYATFSWSLAKEAFKTVKELAKKYDVGFFDCSGTGEINFWDGEIHFIILTEKGTRKIISGIGDADILINEIESLNKNKNNWLVFEPECSVNDCQYMQTIIVDGGYNIELRTGDNEFWKHYRYCKINIEKVKEIFFNFFKLHELPNLSEWDNITAELK